MFSFEDFDKLHSLWDGRTDNTSEICSSCGLCCNNVEKTLFPGEYEYMVYKTGQHNANWMSKGCLCHILKDKVKPVICKIFPLRIRCDHTGYYIEKSYWKDYTNNCEQLDFKPVKENLLDFLDYLFSDYQNRLFWSYSFNFYELLPFAKKAYKDHGFSIKPSEMSERLLHHLAGIPFDESDSIMPNFANSGLKRPHGLFEH